FADADLRAACPAHRLEGKYPEGFAEWFDRAPPGPWLYTGGLENWPSLVARLAARRELWGNGADALRLARDPVWLCRLLRDTGLPAPEAVTKPDALPATDRWLVKPVRGAGGSGIRFLTGPAALRPGVYLQEYLDGPSVAALYVGDGRQALLL